MSTFLYLRDANLPARLLPAIACAAILIAGCGAPPHRTDPSDPRPVDLDNVSYPGIVQWSQTLADRMLNDGFLDHEAYTPHPVRMVVSEIENKTNMTNFPEEMILTRVRQKLRNARKVRFVATYGEDATDPMPGRTEELPEDPRFEDPEWREQKFKVARLSLRTQILYRHAHQDRTTENTYEVRMFVVDNATGEVVWEGLSDPIAIQATRPVIGF